MNETERKDMGEGGMHDRRRDKYGREVELLTIVRVGRAFLMTVHVPGIVEVRRAKMNAIKLLSHFDCILPAATSLVQQIQQIIPLTPFVKLLCVLDQA